MSAFASRFFVEPSLSAPRTTVIGATDTGSSRLVYAMVLGLVLVGIAFVLLGVWLIRQTRADLEVLAPLERMGDSEWSKRDPSSQRRMLDELRPPGARPMLAAPLAPPLDAEFEQDDHPVTSFNDLGPGVVAEHRDPTPIEIDVDWADLDDDSTGDEDGSGGDRRGDDGSVDDDGPEPFATP